MPIHTVLHTGRRSILLPSLNPLQPLHLLLIITSNISDLILQHHIRRNPQDKIQPKQIKRLQARQQPESDVLRDPAFILLGLPIELEGADGAESGEDGVEDYEVHVVAEVDPDADEEGEVGEDDGGVYVIEGFGCLTSDQIPDFHEGTKTVGNDCSGQVEQNE